MFSVHSVSFRLPFFLSFRLHSVRDQKGNENSGTATDSTAGTRPEKGMRASLTQGRTAGVRRAQTTTARLPKPAHGRQRGRGREREMFVASVSRCLLPTPPSPSSSPLY
ncbi:hypothetical protein GW17_00025654 [Ensete ventricosum]|nr:hypothetical protein GW17_00025654 [Ensete ventricosum]